MSDPAGSEHRGEIVETALGPIAVARAGEGPPIVLVHGTPGGSDTSSAMGRFLVDAGFELIAPARPGYQETPLDGREAIDSQADLLAAMLDALGLERVGVLTWSGGGPSGYRLAVGHPERVSALVGFASVSGRIDRPREGAEERLMLETSFGNWLLRFFRRHAPKTMISETLAAEGDLTKAELRALVAEAMDDEGAREVVLTAAEACADYGDRRAGIENDWEQFGAIESLELDRIIHPALVIHGSADSDVPPAHTDHAAAAIPGAERLLMEGGTHLCLWAHPDAAAAQARVVALLRQAS